MSRGQIVEWHKDRNIGSVAGCSPDVHGDYFGFNMNKVTDQGLRDYLNANPNIDRPPDCNLGPDPSWVSFTPAGEIATNLARLFRG